MDNNLTKKDEIENLILEYKNTADDKRKHVLHVSIVQKCLPLVKRIASSINVKSMGLSHEDLIQIGSIGLIKAINFYDTGKNTKFHTYVIYFIKGEIRHYLRDKGSLIKAPRDVRDLFYKASKAIKKLNDDGIHEPTREQIARELGVTPDKLNEVVDIEYIKSAVSLDQKFPSDEDETALIDKIPSEDYQEFLKSYEDKIMLKEAVTKLPDELKTIVELCFFEDFSQKEVSEKLNISQMQVSRKVKQALHRLYGIITKQNEDKVL